MMKFICALIAVVGIAVAVCAAAKLPLEGERFADTTMMSLVAVGVAGVALMAWRMFDRPFAQFDRDEVPSANDPLRFVSGLRDPLRQLCRDADLLDDHQLRRRIDDLIDGYVLPFAEARDVVVDRLGVRSGASLLIEFALGERLLNRAWSAAADGDLGEAIAALNEAEHALTSLWKA